jgi:glucose-6-phosphate isomerase
MPLKQSIDTARADRIGEHGVATLDYQGALARTNEALGWLRSRHADGSLPLLRLPETTADLAPLGELARRFAAGATDVVLLGTGGSSLGGQTLVQLSGHAVPGLGLFREGPRLHFFDNLDPDTFTQMMARLPLATTRFIAVSKSGGTAETLMQTAAVIAALGKAGLAREIPRLLIALSEAKVGSKRNGLRELLAPYEVAVLDHDPHVGGRYSVLTNVGLLPAAIAGCDIEAIRRGAATALEPVLAERPPRSVPSAVGAALSYTAALRGKSIAVMMAYADRLERFTRWYVQLWAESLGKDGKGTTPIAALGPVDQHSQQQLFIAGPRDKLVTVVTVGTAGLGPRIDPTLATLSGEPGFGGKSIGDLVAAQGRAMIETFARAGIPVRSIHIETLDEASLGELLMHFMLETIITARLMGVDPFDQPAVEDAKVLAKRYLAGA